MRAYRPGRSASEIHDELVRALEVAERASGCALLWFAEVLDRHLHRDRGHVSIHAYAIEELGFSPKKTEQFLQLARLVLRFGRLRASLAAGRLTWTQVRTIAPILTEASEAHWVTRAETRSRRALAEEIRHAREEARATVQTPDQTRIATPVDRGTTPGCGARSDPPREESRREGSVHVCTPTPTPMPTPMPTPTPTPTPEPAPVAEVMTTVTLRLRPVERARLERLIEALRKRGCRGTREELLLAGLESLLSSPGQAPAAAPDATSRAMPNPGRPSHQVVVHLCPTCRAASTGVGRGERPVDPIHVETLLCDADIVDARGRRRSTIPPSVRRRVLARDRHRCTTPGCGATRCLELHHRVPVSRGGTNDPGNLITLCRSCHRSWHELDRRRRTSLTMPEGQADPAVPPDPARLPDPGLPVNTRDRTARGATATAHACGPGRGG